MKKRIISLFLALTMLIGLAPAVFADEGGFADVASSDWFYAPVQWAVENGITSGLSDTEFGPYATCTRGQVVTFLWAAAGRPEPTATTNPFSDVAESDWFYKPVLWAVENGITSGLSETVFGAYDPCTRGQVMTFLYASAGRPELNAADSPFANVTEGDWFRTPVLWAVENKITSGLSADSFGAYDPCTRGQIVTFLYAASKVETAEPTPAPNPYAPSAEALAAFEALTPADFPEELVIRFDDTDSNFGVLNEDVIQLKDVDVQRSAADETYTFADEAVLKDIPLGSVVYVVTPANREYLFSVGSIDGSTVTPDPETPMDRYYSHLNLHATAELDTEAIEAKSLSRSGSSASSSGEIDVIPMEYEMQNEHTISFGPVIENDSFEVGITGTATFNIEGDVIYSPKLLGEDYVKFYIDASVELAVTSTGKIIIDKDLHDFAKELEIAELPLAALAPGLNLTSELKIPVNVTAEAGFTGTINLTDGYYIEYESGYEEPRKIRKNTKPDVDLTCDGKVEVSIGISMELGADCCNDKVECVLDIGAKGGLSSETDYPDHDFDHSPAYVHMCDLCVDGEIFAEANISLKFQVNLTAKTKLVPIDIQLVKVRISLNSFHLSLKSPIDSPYENKSQFHLGECKNNKWRVEWKLEDKDGSAIGSVHTVRYIPYVGKTITVKSNQYSYLYNGDYTAEAVIEHEGQESEVFPQTNFTVSDCATTVTLQFFVEDEPVSFDERKIYTEYLINGGYEALCGGWQNIGSIYYTQFGDFDNDGTNDLFITMWNPAQTQMFHGVYTINKSTCEVIEVIKKHFDPSSIDSCRIYLYQNKDTQQPVFQYLMDYPFGRNQSILSQNSRVEFRISQLQYLEARRFETITYNLDTLTEETRKEVENYQQGIHYTFDYHKWYGEGNYMTVYTVDNVQVTQTFYESVYDTFEKLPETSPFAPYYKGTYDEPIRPEQ